MPGLRPLQLPPDVRYNPHPVFQVVSQGESLDRRLIIALGATIMETEDASRHLVTLTVNRS